MSAGRVRVADGGDLEAVEALASAFRWSPRRGLRLVADGVESGATVAAVTGPLAEGGCLVGDGPGGPSGCVSVSAHDWETGQLGLAVGHVSPVVTEGTPAERAELGRSLLAAVDGLALDRGMQLLVLKVDSDDDATLQAAQDAGYRVCEHTLAYLNDATAAPGDDVRAEDLRITYHRRGELPTLDPQDLAALMERADRFLTTHFGADRRIEPASVGRLYRSWLRNIVEGDWVDWLVLAHQGDRTVALISLMFDRSVESWGGAPLLVGSFVISSRPGSHALRDMVADIAARTDLGADHCEFVTQSRNVASNRGLQERPSMRFIRSGYTLHRWLDGDGPPA